MTATNENLAATQLDLEAAKNDISDLKGEYKFFCLKRK
jgi:hypothetical protein